ncbi:MAG TPA: hypothetical protein VN706_05690 [Gemmatimonadaceae bacterium]|nr:hypothetical protein [Gemmatimonadaceae bacterium]
MISKRVFKNYTILTATVPAIIVGTGCYGYESAPRTAVRPGQSVRVTLTPAGAAALAGSIGPGATSLDGRIVRRTDTELTLALTQVARGPDQPEEFLQNEPLTMSFANGETFAVRGLDKTRTALTVGGIAALVIAGKAFISQPGIFTTKGGVSQSTK